MHLAAVAPLYIRRRRKLVVPPGAGGLAPAHAATAVKNLESLGYTCTPALAARLATLSAPALTKTYRQLVKTLRKLRGADVAWKPMYPNFPDQVMAASDAELAVEPVALVAIDLGDEAELVELARDLIAAATSLSAQDRSDLALLIEYLQDRLVLPDEIPHKENLAFVGGLLIGRADVMRFFRTATDVLRLAVALSGGDLSLAAPTRFVAIPRRTRRALLAMIDGLAAPDEDIWRHDGAWLRLAERLHPGEHATRYPKAAAAFARLRAGERPHSFNRQVETSLRERDVLAAVARLRTRPGEFARRLDHLLRLDPSTETIDAFAKVAGDVATPVLLQVLTHFEYRTTHEPVRPIFPKGQTAKVYALPNRLPPMASALCKRVVAACEAALIERFRALPPLGNCWLDPALVNYLVPFSQRSASKALRTLVRGSRLPIVKSPTLRFFLWWKEGKVDGKETGRVDIDLSASACRADFTLVDNISWTSLRAGQFNGAHSGDITSAPNGACEFIDLERASMLEAGVRYVVPVVMSYTSHPFRNLPECFLGWMGRDKPGSGEIFEPSTVVDRTDLASDQQISIPAIFDLGSNEMIWVDAGYRERPGFATMVENHSGTIESLLASMTALHRTSLHRLFGLHIAARGNLVSWRWRAETLFTAEESPFDLEAIMARYLA